MGERIKAIHDYSPDNPWKYIWKINQYANSPDKLLTNILKKSTIIATIDPGNIYLKKITIIDMICLENTFKNSQCAPCKTIEKHGLKYIKFCAIVFLMVLEQILLKISFLNLAWQPPP